jgi:acyl carrier protein
MTPIEETIAGIVSTVAEVDRDEIQPGESLRDIGVDSLMGLEIAVHVERTFGIQFDDDELGKIETFDDLVALAAGRLAMEVETA